MKRKRIAVAPESEFRARPRLFRLLSELYAADFEAWSLDGGPAFDAAILWGGLAEKLRGGLPEGLNCLVVAPAAGAPVPAGQGRVNFGTTASLDSCFRGQTMIDECVGDFPALHPSDGDEVVCSIQSHPYWLVRKLDRATVSIVALGPEEIAEPQTVYDHFNRRRWLRLLPFFHFLKQLTGGGWEPPPVRACMMFDDPNLHWPTYGFIDLRKLARHARELKYHVSFAMVPMDAWLVNPRVSALFRENRETISLCMHGNDHTRIELGAALGADYFTRLLAQGLRRIERFERRSGVPVSRVMVPPYGAFRESVADPMLNLGYEATCVSRASLTAWNKGKAWAASFGHPVAEFIGSGYPVIPRQVMAPGHEGSYRLAAFLNQPIIPHGHHQDCSNGLDLLSNAANSINSLGKVVWSDMASISRSNYLTRRMDGTLVVKMLARRITLPVAEGVQSIVVERPWISAGGQDELLVCEDGKRTSFSGKVGRQSGAIALPGGGAVELISPPLGAVNCHEVKAPRIQVWSTARRVLCEARDRLAPLAAGIRRKPAPQSPGAPVAALAPAKPFPK